MSKEIIGFVASETPIEGKTGELLFHSDPFKLLNRHTLITYDGYISNFAKVSVNKSNIITDVSLNNKYIKTFAVIKPLTIQELIQEQLAYWELNPHKKGRKAYLSQHLNTSLNIKDKNAHVVTKGNETRLLASGTGAQLAILGDQSKLLISGDGVQAIALGHACDVVITGNSTQAVIASSRCSVSTTGNDSRLVVEGDCVAIMSSGYDIACVCNGGNGSIHLAGKKGRFRGVAGTLISSVVYSSEYGYDTIGIITGRIGEGDLKPDTWYYDLNGKFVELAAYDEDEDENE